MPSAACYTNRRRVLAESSITKVQYPGKIAVNNDAILSVQNCSPNFAVLLYRLNPKCNKNCSVIAPPFYPFNYTGGNAFSNPGISQSGGNAFSNPGSGISGGSANT